MNEIGIRIFWGPWGGEFDSAPVVSLGLVVGDIQPSAPDLVKEDTVWMIKLDQWKSVFARYSKETVAGNEKQLLICVAIPQKMRLADNKSPLALLVDLKSLFTQLFPHDPQAVLPSQEVAKAEFEKLVGTCSLTERGWYVYSMEGDTPASFCVEDWAQLEALMKYNAYPALAHVEHLELGFDCESTVEINTKGKTEDKPQKEKKRKKPRPKKEKSEKKEHHPNWLVRHKKPIAFVAAGVVLIFVVLAVVGMVVTERQKEEDLYIECFSSKESCQKYLSDYPEGKYRYDVYIFMENITQDSIENEAYQKCFDSNLDTAFEACGEYLRKYNVSTEQRGQHVDEVYKRLDVLTEKRKRVNTLR